MTTFEWTANATDAHRTDRLDRWTRVLCVLFFCSGFPALIYQLNWQRAMYRAMRRAGLWPTSPSFA